MWRRRHPSTVSRLDCRPEPIPPIVPPGTTLSFIEIVEQIKESPERSHVRCGAAAAQRSAFAAVLSVTPSAVAMALQGKPKRRRPSAFSAIAWYANAGLVSRSPNDKRISAAVRIGCDRVHFHL